jgi:hypothetical protein
MDNKSDQTPNDVLERIANSLEKMERIWRDEAVARAKDREEQKDLMRKYEEKAKAMNPVDLARPKIPWQVTATWIVLMLFGALGIFTFLWDLSQRFFTPS